MNALALFEVVALFIGQRFVRAEVDAPSPAVVVVDRHPHMAAKRMVSERRNQVVPRKDPLGDAPVERVWFTHAPAKQREPAVVLLDLEGHVAVLLDVVVGFRALVKGIVIHLVLVYEGHVAGVDAALHRLQVVALLGALGHEHMAVRQIGPLDARWLGLLVLWTHVSPYNSGAFDAGVTGDRHPFAHLWRLRHVDAIAMDVELQAVVAAADSVTFIASEVKRRSAVRAKLADESRAALAVAKGEQLFAEDLHADLRSVGFWYFARKQNRNPVAAQQVACGGAWARVHQRLHHVFHGLSILRLTCPLYEQSAPGVKSPAASKARCQPISHTTQKLPKLVDPCFGQADVRPKHPQRTSHGSGAVEKRRGNSVGPLDEFVVAHCISALESQGKLVPKPRKVRVCACRKCFQLAGLQRSVGKDGTAAGTSHELFRIANAPSEADGLRTRHFGYA